MRAARSRRLVIDACIAGSASTTEHPVSKSCREFLQSVLSICHRVVMTEAISEEWRAHRSNFTATWQAGMVARKKALWIQPVGSVQVRDGIPALDLTDKEREAILKDVHLIEAALETDRVIVSSDDRARALFRRAANRIKPIRKVMWINPTVVEERAVEWLEAAGENHRKLHP